MNQGNDEGATQQPTKRHLTRKIVVVSTFLEQATQSGELPQRTPAQVRELSRELVMRFDPPSMAEHA